VNWYNSQNGAIICRNAQLIYSHRFNSVEINVFVRLGLGTISEGDRNTAHSSALYNSILSSVSTTLQYPDYCRMHEYEEHLKSSKIKPSVYIRISALDKKTFEKSQVDESTIKYSLRCFNRKSLSERGYLPFPIQCQSKCVVQNRYMRFCMYETVAWCKTFHILAAYKNNYILAFYLLDDSKNGSNLFCFCFTKNTLTAIEKTICNSVAI